MTTMDYYGRSPVLDDEFKSKKNVINFKFAFSLSFLISIMVLGCMNFYLLTHIDKKTTRMDNYLLAVDENVALLKTEMIRGIKPRLMLIDKVITYQLPSAIIRAFEISHQDLRISLSTIMLDLKRVVELYKALLGFGDDWILSPDAQQLQCSWLPRGESRYNTTDFSYDDSTNSTNFLNQYTQDTISDYNVISDLQSLLQNLFKLIQSNRTYDYESHNNTSETQYDQYLNFEEIIKGLYSDINNLTNIIKSHEKLNGLTYNHYLYNKRGELKEIIESINYPDFVNNKTPKSRKMKIKRSIQDKVNIFETTVYDTRYYRYPLKLTPNTFYSNTKRSKPFNINLGSHKIKKRYVAPGVYRLPTYSYPPKKDNPQKTPTLADPFPGNSINFQSADQSKWDPCRTYKIPGYNVYYCKISHDLCAP